MGQCVSVKPASATFDQVPGVTKTTVGYTGGATSNPTYQTVCAGDGHSEAIQVEYDPTQIKYEDILEVFFKNSSGESRGRRAQYKSAIWYHTEQQKRKAEEVAKRKGKGNGVLDIEEAKPWYDAEGYHQKYYLGGRGRR